jgi:hypothetical protein
MTSFFSPLQGFRKLDVYKGQLNINEGCKPHYNNTLSPLSYPSERRFRGEFMNIIETEK